MEDLTKIRDDILKALLPDVAFDGWTWKGAESAAIKAGYGGDMARAVFPGGLKDMLDGFSDYIDRLMLAKLADIDPETLRVRDRIRMAVLTRLSVLEDYREAERLALSYWAVPSRNLKAGKILWRSADRIWNWAGDTARDYNRYTKRGLLGGVMSSTLLVWLDDVSKDGEVTRAFLDRRIENVMQLGRFLGKIKKAS